MIDTLVDGMGSAVRQPSECFGGSKLGVSRDDKGRGQRDALEDSAGECRIGPAREGSYL